MKKIFFLLVSLCILSFVYAQEHSYKKDTTPSVVERLNLLEKKSDKLNLFFNFQGSFDVQDDGSNDFGAKFRVGEIRLEAKGYLTDKLFYRIRHRLNQSNKANSLDNLSSATDMLYAGYHFNDKFTFVFGKQCQNWGGFEFDLNPIHVYQYSEFGNMIDCFMLGASFIYNPNKNHEFVLQVTDSRSSRFEDIYGDLSSQHIEASKTPLTYIFNWNGNLFDNILKTRWAVGLQTDGKNEKTYSVSLGTMLNLPKFQLAVDYMNDNSDIDRLGIVTNEYLSLYYLNSYYPTMKVLEDVNYNSFIAKAEYQPSNNWNIFLKGVYETAEVESMPNIKNRKVLGYYAGVEYLPFKDQELRLFLLYLGKRYEYDNRLGLSNYDTNRVSLGIIYRIKAF